MASCIHFSTPWCVSLWYICPLSEPGSPRHSIKGKFNNLLLCLPLLSDLLLRRGQHRTARENTWRAGRGGGASCSTSASEVTQVKGYFFYSADLWLWTFLVSVLHSVKAERGSTGAGFDWAVECWWLWRNWKLSSRLQLLFMRNWAESCLALQGKKFSQTLLRILWPVSILGKINLNMMEWFRVSFHFVQIWERK